MWKEFTMRELKHWVEMGMAHDLTPIETRPLAEDVARHADVIAYVPGVSGRNGLLVQDRRTGEYYAILGRASNLFLF